MAHNRPAMEILMRTADGGRRPAHGAGFPRWTRMRARMIAHRLDLDLDRNHVGEAGSALAAHAHRITSFAEREHLARALRSTTRPSTGLSFSVPVHHDAIAGNAALIDQVALRLHSPLPVRARGMARLRLLLSDGSGPLYQPGRGSLAAQLRGVLAAL